MSLANFNKLFIFDIRAGIIVNVIPFDVLNHVNDDVKGCLKELCT